MSQIRSLEEFEMRRAKLINQSIKQESVFAREERLLEAG